MYYKNWLLHGYCIVIDRQFSEFIYKTIPIIILFQMVFWSLAEKNICPCPPLAAILP
jgi:hypothetical protein